jgi:hypothetical protein
LEIVLATTDVLVSLRIAAAVGVVTCLFSIPQNMQIAGTQ